MRTTETFEQHLRKSNLSENTIHSYLWTVDFYHAHYDEVNKENLLAYKGYLMEFFKPKTVNLRIQAMNRCRLRRKAGIRAHQECGRHYSRKRISWG